MDFDDKKQEVREMIEIVEVTGNRKRLDRLKKGLVMASALYSSDKIGAHRILNRLLKHTDIYGCAPVDWLEASVR